jgi:hypothetical protein
MTIVNKLPYFHLFVSIWSTFSVITQRYLFASIYLVGICCSLDYTLHILSIRKMKMDMCLHHLFAMLIVVNFHNHITIIPIHLTEYLNTFISNILIIEVSTIFLILNNIVKEETMKWFKRLNQIFFIASFVYSRIYNYNVYIIFNPNIHHFIFVVSMNQWYRISILFAIYNMYLLNLYWLYLILSKVLNLNVKEHKYLPHPLHNNPYQLRSV